MQDVEVGRDCTDLLYMATRIALIHEEVSEALKELRTIPYNRELFAGELADILIRTGDLAILAGIDLDHATRIKMAYNKTREPKHGKAF
jgi:NTP pyrophosphatase (non-canonical NTP hydrolase)